MRIEEKIFDIWINWIFRTTHAKNYENIFKFAKDMSRIWQTLFFLAAVYNLTITITKWLPVIDSLNSC